MSTETQDITSSKISVEECATQTASELIGLAASDTDPSCLDQIGLLGVSQPLKQSHTEGMKNPQWQIDQHHTSAAAHE